MARNKELNQKIKDERRAGILSAALGLFATRGLAGTKISDIAEASGVSHGLLYHYFRSKEEIFTELIRFAFERINAACAYLESLPDPPARKIRMAVEGLLKNLTENADAPLYYLLIAQTTTMSSIPEAAKKIIATEKKTPYMVMERIIRQGQKEGAVKDYDAADLALVFWASVRGLAINCAIDGKHFKMPDPAIITSMFIKGD